MESSKNPGATCNYNSYVPCKNPDAIGSYSCFPPLPGPCRTLHGQAAIAEERLDFFLGKSRILVPSETCDL